MPMRYTDGTTASDASMAAALEKALSEGFYMSDDILVLAQHLDWRRWNDNLKRLNETEKKLALHYYRSIFSE